MNFFINIIIIKKNFLFYYKNSPHSIFFHDWSGSKGVMI